MWFLKSIISNDPLSNARFTFAVPLIKNDLSGNFLNKTLLILKNTSLKRPISHNKYRLLLSQFLGLTAHCRHHSIYTIYKTVEERK